MQIKTELSAFLQELHDDVLSRIPTEADLSGTAAEIAFTELVAEELAEYGAIDDIIPCLLDVKTAKGIIRTHGYYVSEERDRLDLFVTVYRNANDGDTITQTDVRQGYERAKRILQLIDDGWDIGDPDQSDQATMIEAIREAAASIRESRVFIITDCVARDTNEVKEIFCERDVRCVIWDATRLLRIRNSGKAYESIEIDISQLCPGGLPCPCARASGSSSTPAVRPRWGCRPRTCRWP